MTGNPWLPRITRPTAPRLRVALFAHAGGSPGTYGWLAGQTPFDVEIVGVALPGRDRRFAEPLLTGIPEMATAVAAEVAGQTDAPWVFFGHSMGALLAFETARALDCVRHLVVLGYPAPHLPVSASGHLLSNVDLAAALRFTGGLPDVVLDEPELLELVLPIARADLRAVETYQHQPGEALPCPITAIRGEFDDTVTADEMAAWRAHTGGDFTYQAAPGGHFPNAETWQQIMRSLW